MRGSLVCKLPRSGLRARPPPRSEFLLCQLIALASARYGIWLRRVPDLVEPDRSWRLPGGRGRPGARCVGRVSGPRLDLSRHQQGNGAP